jgi:hypothetical protein
MPKIIIMKSIYYVFFFIFFKLSFTFADELDAVTQIENDLDISEKINSPGAIDEDKKSSNVTGNGKRVRFLKNPLYPSNPNLNDWVKLDTHLIQHVPLEARTFLNHQIYFNKQVGSREKYIEAYFENEYVYLAACEAKLYFDSPYNKTVGNYFFYKPKCKQKVIKISLEAAQNRLSNNLAQLTIEILLPPRGLEFVTRAFEMAEAHVKEVVPRNKDEFELFVDGLFEVTPQPNKNINDFLVGMVEQGASLVQDTVNLLHLQNRDEKEKIVSVENFENFKRDLKRIIMQLHQNAYPPPLSLPKPVK